MTRTINPANKFHKTIAPPGDKSISHRAVMLGSIANGTTTVTNFLMGEDCLSTIDCFRKMGVDITVTAGGVSIRGVGPYGLKKPSETLCVGNSGTAIRLMTGLLAAQGFYSEITGDESIQRRPMGRVITPLKEMGALIESAEGNRAPLKITGAKLKGIDYTMPVASAQVKSAILLASLYADGETVIREAVPTRDHTEIMLNYMGASIHTRPGIKTGSVEIISKRISTLTGGPVTVPGDISSAAFFIVAALILPDARVTLTNVGVNPTRTGIIDALRKMGADIRLDNPRTVCGEAVADITAQSSKLIATELGGALIPRMIDEVPAAAVAACFAEGTTIIKDAAELKVKESNRIYAVVNELKKMGADIEETEDGMVIRGGKSLKGAVIDSHNDHRIAMSMAVAGLAANGPTHIENAGIVDISFPGFFDYMES